MALAFNQQILAVVIEFPDFDAERIELIGVSALVPNRGGIRLRPLDDVEGVPICGARIRDPVFEGGSSYIDIGNGVLGRAPIEPDLELTCSDGDVTIESLAYQSWSTISATVTVASGATQARSGCLRVTDPDGNFDFGDLLKMPPQPEIFADGFESGNTSVWSSSVD